MPIRLQEVASVLALIVMLMIAKHIPIFDPVMLSRVTGIICFAFAIFIALRMFHAELEALRED